jgi:serine/threonine protein kinase
LLPLIPAAHINLAGPPSLDSCTRDVYPDDLRIPLPAVLRLAHSIAAAVAHLHQQGVMHGDLYAHNILWNPASGEALLSDFGAATLLPQNQPVLANALKALEVRAFGCLLEELAIHAEPDGQRAPSWGGLMALAKACLHADPGQRPAMADLARELSGDPAVCALR